MQHQTAAALHFDVSLNFSASWNWGGGMYGKCMWWGMCCMTITCIQKCNYKETVITYVGHIWKFNCIMLLSI